jgi:hypothetical protein
MPREKQPHGKLIATCDAPDQRFVAGSFSFLGMLRRSCGRSRPGKGYNHC